MLGALSQRVESDLYILPETEEGGEIDDESDLAHGDERVEVSQGLGAAHKPLY